MRARLTAAAICGFVLVGCHAKETDQLPQVPRDVTLSELSKRIGLELPAGTELVGSARESGIDEAVRAKIALSPDGWSELLTRAALSETDFTDEKRYLLGKNDGWWDPERVTSLPAAQAEVAPGRFLDLGVDRSESSRILVYLLWHET
jgi:hypothetical protein